jgi:hypothetical protein
MVQSHNEHRLRISVMKTKFLTVIFIRRQSTDAKLT